MSIEENYCSEIRPECLEPPEVVIELREMFEEWFGSEYAYERYTIEEDFEKGVIEFDHEMVRDACKDSLSPRVCRRYFLTGLDALLSKYGFIRDRKLRKRKVKVSKKAIRWLKEKIGATDEAIQNLINNLRKQKVIRYTRLE